MWQHAKDDHVLYSCETCELSFGNSYQKMRNHFRSLPDTHASCTRCDDGFEDEETLRKVCLAVEFIHIGCLSIDHVVHSTRSLSIRRSSVVVANMVSMCSRLRSTTSSLRSTLSVMLAGWVSNGTTFILRFVI